MNKKFEFTGETKKFNLGDRTIVLQRIRAVAEFGLIKAGDLGGWVEKEENLSQEGNAWVSDNANVCGNAKVFDNANVCDDALVSDNANVCGNAEVYDNAKVYGNAYVCGNAEVYGNAKVWGNADVWDNAYVCGNAEVFSAGHVMVIGAIGSRSDFTTFYRGKFKQIMVKCGCFNDTIDKFLEKVKQTHGNSKHARVYRAAAEVARIQIDLSCEPQESEDNE